MEASRTDDGRHYHARIGTASVVKCMVGVEGADCCQRINGLGWRDDLISRNDDVAFYSGNDPSNYQTLLAEVAFQIIGERRIQA